MMCQPYVEKYVSMPRKKKQQEVATPTTTRSFWHNYGPIDGPPYVNSLAILIEWLTVEGNFAKWKGGDRHSGVTKAVLSNQIAQIIKSKGIVIEINGKSVLDKLTNMEPTFKRACDFLDGMGAGITYKESLKADVTKICPYLCPYFYELQPIMADRSSTRAPTTEDDLFDSDSDVNVNSDGSEDNTIETAHAAVPVPTPNSAKHALPSPSPTASKKSCSSSSSSRPTSVRKPKAQQSGVGQNQSDLIGLKHEQLTY
jgi:hypothetical protein